MLVRETGVVFRGLRNRRDLTVALENYCGNSHFLIYNMLNEKQTNLEENETEIAPIRVKILTYEIHRMRGNGSVCFPL